MNSGLAER